MGSHRTRPRHQAEAAVTHSHQSASTCCASTPAEQCARVGQIARLIETAK
jgi:hypothetical protein